MPVTLSPLAGAGQQFFDNNGNPLTGGKLYTYLAGTSTPTATYTTVSGAVAHTNPIILDSAGRVPSGGEIWLTQGTGYKFVLATPVDVVIATYDNIPSSAQPPVVNDADAVPYEQGYTVTAGGFTIGRTYRILTIGNTDFTLIGAASNIIGVHFIATGVGTGTGTAEYSRSVEAKFRDVASPMDFGAVGDGVADDLPAIQAAIATGKALYFPQPSVFYNIPTNLTINVPFEAGLYRVFGGAGAVTLGANSVAQVHPHWWGAEATQVATIDATVAAKNTAAFNAAFLQSKYVVFPQGNYQINGTIFIRQSCNGSGTRTTFYPTGNFAATSIRSVFSAEIGLFSVDYSLVSNSSLNVCAALALGSTSVNDQTVSCRIYNIYGNNCYRVVQYTPSNLGVVWNITLDSIIGNQIYDRVVYFEAASGASTLITIKNSGSLNSRATSKGFYCANMSEVHIYDSYVDGGASGAGSLLDCFASNIDVDGFHVEGHTSTISDGESAPILLRASTGSVTAKNMYFSASTFSPGSAVNVFWMRFSGRVELGSVSELSNVVNDSATKYLAFMPNATAFNSTQRGPEDFFGARINSSYGVAPAAGPLAVTSAATTLIATPLGGRFNDAGQCGLFLVNGISTLDGGVGFTDLILVTANGATARTVVVLSTNSTGGAVARTYSISGLDIQLAMASGTYNVSIKGLTMARSR